MGNDSILRLLRRPFPSTTKIPKKKVKKQNFDCFLMMLMIFFFLYHKKKVKMKNKYGSGRPLFFYLYTVSGT